MKEVVIVEVCARPLGAMVAASRTSLLKIWLLG